MSVELDDIEIGSTISLKSKNSNDLRVLRGTLESRGSYRMISRYIDPRAYNESVRQSDPGVTSDILSLTYFLITLDNNASEPVIIPFAEEWIKPGSLSKIDLAKQITLKIDDPFNDDQKIISLLASAGYSSVIEIKN